MEDDDEEEEGRGKFNVASSECLQQRLIKKARRQTAGDNGAEKTGGGLFSGIKLMSTQPPPVVPKTVPTVPPPSNKCEDARYLEQLNALNTSFCAWITKHVAENPFVDLTPVFKDYERHLATIEKTPAGSGEGVQERAEKVFGKEETTLGPGVEKKVDVKTEIKIERKEAPKMQPVQKEADEDGDDGDDGEEPQEEEKPKHKSTVDDELEKDALMKTRAKLFYKKGEEFIELGTGNLLVCKTTGSGVQLLMRNETTLAKVLLNVRVTAQMPLTLKGNNVFLVCMPNPPLTAKPPDNPTPATYLIRVKTGDIASSLHSTIKQSSQ